MVLMTVFIWVTAWVTTARLSKGLAKARPATAAEIKREACMMMVKENNTTRSEGFEDVQRID